MDPDLFHALLFLLFILISLSIGAIISSLYEDVAALFRRYRRSPGDHG